MSKIEFFIKTSSSNLDGDAQTVADILDAFGFKRRNFPSVFTINTKNKTSSDRYVDLLVLLIDDNYPETILNDLAIAEQNAIPILLIQKNGKSKSDLPSEFKDVESYVPYNTSTQLENSIVSLVNIIKEAHFDREMLKKISNNKKSIKELEREVSEIEKEKKRIEEEKNKIEGEGKHIEEILSSRINVLIEEKAQIELALQKANEEKERGIEIETKLSEAFKGLTGLNKDMRADINRLNVLFVFYFILTLGFFYILYRIWDDAFTNLKGEDFELAKVWIYSAPSFVLVGFIGAFMHQISRAQRQLLYLKKYNRKYKVIKVALQGYYAVEDELKKTPQKAQEIFELIIKVKLGQNIDFDDEEKKAKASEAQDQSIKEDFAKQIIDAIKSIGNKKE